MPDLLTTLAERLRWVSLPWGQGTIALTDEGCDAIAREALVAIVEALPTREDIARLVAAPFGDSETHEFDDIDGGVADAILRDLWARLGGGKR